MLKEYLTNSRQTQSSFAEHIGITRAYLSEIIAGKKVPSLAVAFAIASATDGQVPVEAWRSVADQKETQP